MPIEVQSHDSSLGRWRFARWSPPPLASVVSTIWYFEGTLAYLRERHFPDGLIDLVVHLGPVYRQVEGDRSEPFNRTCVAGLQLGTDVIEAPPGPSAVLGMELRPVGAFCVLGRPLHELTGQTVNLEDIAAGAATELAELCAAAATPEERLSVAACWIDARVRSGPAPARAVAWMARELERRNGIVPIGMLQARTGWSRTRLTTVFREQIGVPPKTLARIYRFRRALKMVHQAAAPLTDIALATGYYDQPHFNAEFRELSGFAPREYLAQVRYPESVSVAEAAL